MSDLTEKEFEAAFRKEFGFGRLAASAIPDAQQMMRAAWWAWQASRECLVIELPEPRVARGYGEQVAEALGFNDGINYCEEAIHTAGVKTK